MDYMDIVCLVNAVLLVLVAALLFTSSRVNRQRELELATGFATVLMDLRRSAGVNEAQLGALQQLADKLLVHQKSFYQSTGHTARAGQTERLASTTTSAAELADLAGLSRAEATLMLNIQNAKADANLADSPYVNA